MSTQAIIAETDPTGYPFNHSRAAYDAELEFIPTSDLIAQVEAWQWLALKSADDPDGSRAHCETRLEAMVMELERRQRLMKARHQDPLRPSWPQDTDAMRARVQAVKDAWSMERMCRELLLMDLTPTGNGRWKSHCPMPGHQEKTPSFVVYPDDRAWCFGCSRGGDVISIAQHVLNLERFTDALRMLENEGGRS